MNYNPHSTGVLTEETILNWMADGIQQDATYMYIIYDPLLDNYYRHLIPEGESPRAAYQAYQTYGDESAERIVKMIDLTVMQEFTY